MQLQLNNRNLNVKINDISTNVGGTHLQGYITIPYDAIVNKLGNPQEGCDKTQAEWTIEIESNEKSVVANLYDYKEYRSVEQVTEWHIGGFNQDALKLIQCIFPNHVARKNF